MRIALGGGAGDRLVPAIQTGFARLDDNYQMKETTRQKLIDATYEEIYSNGYQGAALADILSQAGVHKGSMYHFFANKKEMAIHAIREKMQLRFENLYYTIAHQEGPVLPRLYELIRDTSRRDFKRGCPIANLVQEMSNIDEDFNGTMKTIYGEFRSSIQAIFDRAVENGELKSCDTLKLALFATSALEGALLAVKASGDPQDYVDCVECLIGYIETFRG